MGAVLSQVQDGQERAICYASKVFSKAQTRYSATIRELLTVVNFTRHFKHHLLDQKFTIITDHRALQWLHNFKDADALTARWLEKLAAFNYEIVHRPENRLAMPMVYPEHHLEHLMQLQLKTQLQMRLKKTKNGQTARLKVHLTPNISNIRRSKAMYCNQLTPLRTVFQLTSS